MDNGKLRLWHFKKATILEVYTSSELTLADIIQVLASFHKTSKTPYLLIIVNTANLRLSLKAQIRLHRVSRKYLKIACVIKGQACMRQAFRASNTYLKRKDVYLCDSIDSAYKTLIQVA